jgi:hypothetical protein
MKTQLQVKEKNITMEVQIVTTYLQAALTS